MPAGDHQGTPASWAEDWPEESALEELEAIAVALATEAGRLVRDERPDDLRVVRTTSNVLDIVTAMDIRSETLLRSRLGQVRPEDGILGEEDGHTAGVSGLTWVLDPIDGTVNYLYGLPGYAVSVAVVVGDPRVPGAWTPVAGAVHNPSVDEVFHARAGGGARVDRPAGPGAAAYTRGVDLHVGEPAMLSQALIGTGFSYSTENRRHQGAVAAALLPQVRDLRRMGAAALDLCHVAAGRIDAYYERGLKPWDLAAGALVVTEAGGCVTGFDAPASEEMTLAAAPGFHAELHTLLRDLHLKGARSLPRHE